MKRVQFEHGEYQAVCDFLVALNRCGTAHLNWNWARWEWMYAHPYCVRELLNTIGLWKVGDAVVGAAIFDLYHGEAFCAALPGYETLLPEIYAYAYDRLRDENGLGIAVAESDDVGRAMLCAMGYQKGEQTEVLSVLKLDGKLAYTLPDGLSIRPICFPEDAMAYYTVIWKGFDHESDRSELQSMLQNQAPLPPHMLPALCLGVDAGEGEFVAHCTCWYDPRTDYAYIEPVCTVPAYRGRGLAKAVLCEALNRCAAMGAQRGMVLSDQMFYQKLGFTPLETYTFYWKREL